ncbi:MAG: bioH [Patescibacteria group bacterium]|nr:bioH [Patescibacteria group bacterium]
MKFTPYYEISGQGEPVVFVHGFTLDHRMWRPQIEAFQSDYKCVSYDLRGFGASDLPEGKYAHYDDLQALLDQLNIETAHIVGLSMGGRVAIDFALRHPAYVRTLTLIDSALSGFPSRGAVKPDIAAIGLEAAKAAWLSEPLFAGEQGHPEALGLINEIVADYSGWHWSHPNTETQLAPPAVDRLGELAMPTLVMVGEDDVTGFQECARHIAKNAPRTTFETIERAGHMANLDNPGRVNELLRSHLKLA